MKSVAKKFVFSRPVLLRLQTEFSNVLYALSFTTADELRPVNVSGNILDSLLKRCLVAENVDSVLRPLKLVVLRYQCAIPFKHDKNSLIRVKLLLQEGPKR